jgi:hypothetical protein
MKYRRLLAAITLGAAIGSLGWSTGHVARADSPLPLAISHQHFNGLEGFTGDTSSGTMGISNTKNPTGAICSTTTASAANVSTDCEGTNPHNETSIAIDPTNPSHLIGAANDYQIRLDSGGAIYETVLTRAHVSFDGGKTWTEYGIVNSAYNATGDPAVAFDAAGHAYLATLGFGFSQGNGCCKNPDIVLSHSTDGGKTWSPVRVAAGSGSFGSVGTFNDKEYIAAWGNGNIIVTWTDFNDLQGGSYGGSPIMDSVSHDGGTTWTAPQQISGSASFCVGFSSATACDEDQGSTPVVAADGSIYVSFLSTGDASTGRDNYVVVKVDPTSGRRIAGPFKVANLFDGVTDYPINIDGRQTYQDSQFRTWSLGNIAADPANASHLAVVWSDMRNSQLPAPADPYSAKTNSDVGVSQSFDGGATWSAPTIISKPGDQFMPWAAYDGRGLLHIGYFDRSYDSANHKYGYTLASESKAGSLKFSFSEVSTALSDPTQGDRWFSGTTANSSFPHPTTFLGDYSGIAGTATGAHSYWTDMRLTACLAPRCGSGEDAYFG